MMTRDEKKQVVELINTIQKAISTLQLIIEKDEEPNVRMNVPMTTVSESENKSIPKEIDEKMIKKLLREMGVPVNIKGYRYICYAVECLSKEKGMKISLGLYPKVAKKFDTTGSRVERAIRHAVERTFEMGSYEVLDEVFGDVVRSRGKVTNSEFLYTCVEYLEDNLSR